MLCRSVGVASGRARELRCARHSDGETRPQV